MRKTLSILALLVFSNIAMAIPATYFHVTDSSANNEISLMTSDTARLLIWRDGYQMSYFDVKIEAVGPGILDNPIIKPEDRNPYYDLIIQSDMAWEISARWDGSVVASSITNPLATIDFHFDGPGDVTLGLYRADGPNWVPLNNAIGIPVTITIHQIPEPITLVFLCLGGLMLRRRK
jgi:hypothetical protein